MINGVLLPYLYIMVVPLLYACDIPPQENIVSSSTLHSFDSQKLNLENFVDKSICSPYIESYFTLDLNHDYKSVKLCVVVKVSEKSEITVTKNSQISSGTIFKINSTSSTQLEYEFNVVYVQSLNFSVNHGEIQICYVGLKELTSNEEEKIETAAPTKTPQLIRPMKELAIISRTYYGSAKSKGFGVSKGCDRNIYNENNSYEVYLLKTYIADKFHLTVYFNITKGSSGFLQVRAGENQDSKSEWKSYGILAADETGMYNMSGSLENQRIRYVILEWNTKGMVDAVCGLEIEVLESVQVSEVDLGNMVYLGVLAVFPIALVVIAVMVNVGSTQQKKKMQWQKNSQNPAIAFVTRRKSKKNIVVQHKNDLKKSMDFVVATSSKGSAKMKQAKLSELATSGL